MTSFEKEECFVDFNFDGDFEIRNKNRNTSILPIRYQIKEQIPKEEADYVRFYKYTHSGTIIYPSTMCEEQEKRYYRDVYIPEFMDYLFERRVENDLKSMSQEDYDQLLKEYLEQKKEKQTETGEIRRKLKATKEREIYETECKVNKFQMYEIIYELTDNNRQVKECFPIDFRSPVSVSFFTLKSKFSPLCEIYDNCRVFMKNVENEFENGPKTLDRNELMEVLNSMNQDNKSKKKMKNKET